MSVNIIDNGTYEIFETTKNNRLLVLNNRGYYAWISTPLGNFLVGFDADHQKASTVQQGNFFLLTFKNNPQFKDIPHLFLEKNYQYQELVLPNGLPTEQDKQKKIINTYKALGQNELENYLKHHQSLETAQEGISRPIGSMSNIVNYLKGLDFPADKQKIILYAQDFPKDAIAQLEKIADKNYIDLAELSTAIGECRQQELIDAAQKAKAVSRA